MRLTGHLQIDQRSRVSIQNEGRNLEKRRSGDFWQYRNIDSNVTISGSRIEATLNGNVRNFEGEGTGTVTLQGSGSYNTSSQNGRISSAGTTIDFGRNRNVY
jgi:hypothetical protein